MITSLASQHSDVRRKTCHPTKFTAIPIYEEHEDSDLSVTIGNNFFHYSELTKKKPREIHLTRSQRQINFTSFFLYIKIGPFVYEF